MGGLRRPSGPWSSPAHLSCLLRGAPTSTTCSPIKAGRHEEDLRGVPYGSPTTPLPTIAAVNGAAVGAGFNMVLACDIVVAAEAKARFDSRFLQIALHPGGGHTWRLRSIAGRQTTMAMVLFGEVIRAQQALELGLVWKVVDDAALIDESVRSGCGCGRPGQGAQRPHKGIDPCARQPSRNPMPRSTTNSGPSSGPWSRATSAPSSNDSSRTSVPRT